MLGAAIAIGIAALVAVVLFVPRLIGGSGRTADAILAEPSTTRSGTPTPAPMAATAGGCWTAARVSVGCRATHRYEVMPGPIACTTKSMTEFLGGGFLVDVPIRVRVIEWPGGRCAVDLGRDVHGSARNVLHGPAPDWRTCYDSRTKTVVRCSQPHTGEYVGTGSIGPASPRQCAEATRKYINKPPGSYRDKLDVRPAGDKCLVSGRGDHLLTTTIHNLGVWPVPLTV